LDLKIAASKSRELNKVLLVLQPLQFKLDSQLGAGKVIKGLFDIAKDDHKLAFEKSIVIKQAWMAIKEKHESYKHQIMVFCQHVGA
jgi:hypothetical protein